MRFGLSCPFCYKAAFYFRKKPALGEVVCAAIAYAETAIKPVDGMAMHCQWCNQRIHRWDLSDQNLKEYD